QPHAPTPQSVLPQPSVRAFSFPIFISPPPLSTSGLRLASSNQEPSVAPPGHVLYTDFSHFFRGSLLRVALRIVGWFLTLLILVGGGIIWWLFFRPLPQVDGTASLPGLQNQVTVERDGWGVPHLRATSLADMAEAQGYVMAQDRLWQMDLLRRVARGQLSEILGSLTVPVDEHFRTLRFGPAAERDAALLDDESRTVMEAYSRGVNKFIEQHQKNLPVEFRLLKYQPQPWRPSDSLVIGAYMYETLTETWEEEFHRAQVAANDGPEKHKDLYSVDAALDHCVVGDSDAPGDGSQRSGDSDDDEDEDDTSQDDLLKARAHPADAQPGFTDLTTALAPSVLQWLGESEHDIRHALGSNNWVVSGDHTATGKPLLANDTHLELSVPPIWYQIHLTCPGWNVKGFTLPGAPLAIIG